MKLRRHLVPLALAGLALLPAAARAQGQFFFIHLPSSTATGTPSIDQITSALGEIGADLQANWQATHPGQTPKVCWAGYAGPWSPGGPNQYNFAGDAANRLGNASSTDNQEGYSVPIDYCAVDEILDELLAKCDIVIAMGEKPNSTSIDLENHGSSTNPPPPDCAGNTPGGPVCSGDGCTGTDWSDPVECETGGGCFIPSIAQWIVCGYEARHAGDPTAIKVKISPSAGAFLCGYACCRAHQ